MSDRAKWYAILASAVGLLVVGFLGGEWWARPTAVPEPPAPAVRQADGSLVVQRVDPATQPQKPPHDLPRGAVEERRVSVLVQPPRGTIFHESAAGVPVTEGLKVDAVDGVGSAARSGTAAGWNPAGDKPAADNTKDSCDCPPVQVDLSLVRMPDKTRRVIASSPSGKILSGVDVPIDTPGELPARHPWAVGILYTADRKFGGFLDRDLGPIRLGADVFQTPTGWGAAARAGFRF